MKKSFFYFALSLLTIAAGCHREEVGTTESANDVMEIYASVETVADLSTRTYLEGTEVLWSEGDQIAVCLGNATVNRFNVKSGSEGITTAVFEKDETYNGEVRDVQFSNNIAWYPFCEFSCASRDSGYMLFVVFPSAQKYAPDSFPEGAFPMVAVTKDVAEKEYSFKNVCGAIMLQLKGSGSIRSVSIKGNSDEYIAGTGYVEAGYGRTPNIYHLNDFRTVTLDCGEDGVKLDSEKSTPFIIVLPPVAFEKGFTITVTDTWGGSRNYVTEKPNPIIRSKIRRMPVQEYIGREPQDKNPEDGDYIDEYGYNYGQGIEIDGVVWAPVNCGYHGKDFRYGKMYQWGRKYGSGFPHTDAVTPSVENREPSLIEGNDMYSADIYYHYTLNDNVSLLDDRLWNAGSEENPIKTEYDPCPSGWRIPTHIEIQGLRKYRSSWTTDELGHNGYSYSGNSPYSETVPQIFLSANGTYIGYDHFSSRDRCGEYWSSLRTDRFEVYCLEFCENGYEDKFHLHLIQFEGKAFINDACSIRCVKDTDELVPVQEVLLDNSSLEIIVGDSKVLSGEISPSYANNDFIHWTSGDKSVAIVDVKSGTVTAIAPGKSVITATAGMKTATCEVTVIPVPGPEEGDYVDEYGINHGQGVDIDGIIWAPVNCGYHQTKFKYGKLYQWGRRYGQGYDGAKCDWGGWEDGTYSDGLVPRVLSGPVSLNEGQSESAENYFYSTDSKPFDWLSRSDDMLWNPGTEDNPKKADYDPCPDGWRIPTYAELESLGGHKSSTAIENGLYGCWFSDSQDSSASVSRVFLPVAGYRGNNGSAKHRCSDGYYWSSKTWRNTTYKLYYGYALHFTDSYTQMFDFARSYGFSVRCVQEQ